jgi:hypothetical protein
MRHYLENKLKKQKHTESKSQVVEHLSNKHEALISIPSMKKKNTVNTQYKSEKFQSLTITNHLEILLKQILAQ